MEVSPIQDSGNRSDSKLLAKFRRRVRRLSVQNQRLIAEQKQSLEKVQRSQSQLELARLELAASRSKIQSLQQTQQTPQTKAFSDPNIFNHHFSASMVALCINLSTIMPLRTVPKTLQVVLPALGIDAKIPNRETLTRWAKRLGLDRLMNNQKSRQASPADMIWIVDHSNQIGTQKVLVILGIPASKLPTEDGTPLQLDDLEVLQVKPAHRWTRDDVRREYKELADKIGRPRWLLCDGAVELRESADVLCDADHTTDVLRDLKHVAANRFEVLIGKSQRFTEFLMEMGKTRCLIQQTELAHLTPPGLKTKARFMNIEPVINWATMVLGVLDNPDAAQAGVQDLEKLEKRMGWLRQYKESIASWRRCCDVIAWLLAWINTHALVSDTIEKLRPGLQNLRTSRCELSDKMTEDLLKAIDAACARVGPNERSWLSSESLESVFAQYKRREGQQSRSGFTGLILTLPTLFRSWTASEVREALRRTRTKDTTDWIKTNIGETLWSKRTKAYAYFSPKVRQKIGAT